MDESIAEAMEAWGAPAEEVARVRERIAADALPPAEETFGVYAENLPVVHAFLALRTQWQYAGMDAQRVGFAYAGVISWINTTVHRRRRRALLADLQVMELAVLIADRELQQQKE